MVQKRLKDGYEHKVVSVTEIDIVEILWDVCIQVDRQTEHWKSDVMVMEDTTNTSRTSQNVG